MAADVLARHHGRRAQRWPRPTQGKLPDEHGGAAEQAPGIHVLRRVMAVPMGAERDRGIAGLGAAGFYGMARVPRSIVQARPPDT